MLRWLVVALSALGISTTATQGALTTVRVASGLQRPLLVTAAPGDCSRIFIVEQRGVILIMKQGNSGGVPTLTMQATPFLDITNRVGDVTTHSLDRSEIGLLGLAFHPQYATNGYFYVHYLTPPNANPPNASIIARFSVTANPDVADPNSEYRILGPVARAADFHIGGMLAFSPHDGYFYFTLGIGGSESTTGPNAQNKNTLLGKLLRINVNNDDFPADPNKNYAIPPGNPFAGAIVGLDEIWAFGFRNPWRFCFDRAKGDLYLGDVGGGTREEINYQPYWSSGGENYGYNIYEGTVCLSVGCSPAGLKPPVTDYAHNPAIENAVLCGCVYRGTRIPSLSGTFFYGDWGHAVRPCPCPPSPPSRIWSFRYVAGAVTEWQERTAELNPGGGLILNALTSFGEDAAGGLYLCSREDAFTTNQGEVYKLVDRSDPQPMYIGETCRDPFADADGDGDVDLDDFGVFQRCLTGEGKGVLDGCRCFNRPEPGFLSGDNDVDANDFNAFLACVSGPAIPANPACDN